MDASLPRNISHTYTIQQTLSRWELVTECYLHAPLADTQWNRGERICLCLYRAGAHDAWKLPGVISGNQSCMIQSRTSHGQSTFAHMASSLL